MHQYQNLLYVSYGMSDETEGLKQALSLARNNNAPLTILVITPRFIEASPEHQAHYETSLLAEVNSSLQSTKNELQLADDAVTISIVPISSDTPSVKIIQHTLQYGHDLVIKEAEPQDGHKGFKALDMDLLRKCPAPVWLCQPITQSRQHIRVAVAIDPESHEPGAEALSKRLLILARSLADSCSGELHILSCWDYPLEAYLRNNAWLKTPADEITKTLINTEQMHLAALHTLIEASGISEPHHVHHLRGEAEDMIPQFTKEKQIDILLMGTVARTGVPGFIIGNTAENTIQKLECSLLALKPQGFVSPIKAY